MLRRMRAVRRDTGEARMMAAIVVLLLGCGPPGGEVKVPLSARPPTGSDFLAVEVGEGVWAWGRWQSSHPQVDCVATLPRLWVVARSDAWPAPLPVTVTCTRGRHHVDVVLTAES